jgi:hypothetical protein
MYLDPDLVIERIRVQRPSTAPAMGCACFINFPTIALGRGLLNCLYIHTAQSGLQKMRRAQGRR